MPCRSKCTYTASLRESATGSTPGQERRTWLRKRRKFPTIAYRQYKASKIFTLIAATTLGKNIRSLGIQFGRARASHDLRPNSYKRLGKTHILTRVASRGAPAAAALLAATTKA